MTVSIEILTEHSHNWDHGHSLSDSTALRFLERGGQQLTVMISCITDYRSEVDLGNQIN